MSETKTCGLCGEDLPLDNFYSNSRQCKKCLAEKRRARNKQKKEKNSIANEIKINENEPINYEVTKPKEEKPVKKDSNSAETFKKLMFKETVKGVTDGIFSLIATRAGDHWKLTKDELDNISDPVTNLLGKLKYASKVAENIDVINLSLVMFGVLTPRVSQTISEKKKGGKKNVQKITKTARPTNDNRVDNGVDTKRREPEKQTQDIHNNNSEVDESIKLYNQDLINDFL